MKKDELANELAAQMKMNMRPRFPTQQEKLAAVFDHLNLAAEYFEEAGNDKFAEMVTNTVVGFAKKALWPEEGSRDHRYMIDMEILGENFKVEQTFEYAGRAKTLGEALLKADQWADDKYPGKGVRMSSYRTGYYHPKEGASSDIETGMLHEPDDGEE